MRKMTKVLLFGVVAVSLAWSGLTTLYTKEVSEELKTLRRENRSDTVYLRSRVRELEGELKELLKLDDLRVDADAPVADTGAEEETIEEDSDPTFDGAPNNTAGNTNGTEEVTVPVHESPETMPSFGAEDSVTDTPVALYVVTEYHGIIGALDVSGEPVRLVNLAVVTLPEADREALRVGIPAYSIGEMEEILERYS